MFDAQKTDQVMSVFGLNPPYTIKHTTNGREFSFEEEFILTLDHYFCGDGASAPDRSFFNFVNGYAAYADTGVDTAKKVYIALDQYLSTIGV